jgi:hypothetical protein
MTLTTIKRRPKRFDAHALLLFREIDVKSLAVAFQMEVSLPVPNGVLR